MNINNPSGNHGGLTRFSSAMARASVLAATLILAVFGLTLGSPSSTAFAAQAVDQCNSVDNTPGLGITCDVTVTNYLDVATGVGSSTISLNECHTAANTTPTPADCAVTDTSYDEVTTSVSQCNYSENGGGASVDCSVTVVNNIVGDANESGATINQCAGSAAEGTEPTLNCDPFPQTTSGATITQCNGSANGGGASKRVTCTVTPSYVTAELPVSINQCNNTANGGGSVVTCDASLTNTITPVAVTPTPTPTPPVVIPTPTPSAPPVSTPPGSTPPVKAPNTPTPMPKVFVPPVNTLHDSKTDGFLLVGPTSAVAPSTVQSTDNGASNGGAASVLLLLAAAVTGLAFTKRKPGVQL